MSDGNLGGPAAVRTPIRIVLADDHPFVLLGLEIVFEAVEFDVVETCADGQSTLAALRRHRPDILLLDLAMPRMNGFDVLRDVRDSRLSTRVVVLTASGDADAADQALALGAHGIMGKTEAPARILQCVREVHRGGTSTVAPRPAPPPPGTRVPQMLVDILTPRELEIVDMIAMALPNKMIASRLQITEGTVKVHLHRIYEKLGVRGRMDLLLYTTRKTG